MSMTQLNKYPLSHTQEAMWILQNLRADEGGYVVRFVLKFSGSLVINTLKQSLEYIYDRHEILRAKFESSSSPRGHLSQFAADDFEIPFFNYKSELPYEDLVAAFKQKTKKFSITSGHLSQIDLYTQNEHSHFLFFAFHHIIFDGTSASLFIKELLHNYERLSQNQLPKLDPLPQNFFEFAKQNRSEVTTKLKEQLPFWKSKFATLPQNISLPYDFPFPETVPPFGSEEKLKIHKSVWGKLLEFAKKRQTTPFTIWCAILYSFLHKISGQKDLVFGIPATTRMNKNLRSLIGCFINTLPVRINHWGDPKFSSIIDTIKFNINESLRHQAVPFSKIVEAVNPVREKSRSPLLDVLVSFQMNPYCHFELQGLSIETMAIQEPSEEFSLSFDAVQNPDNLEVSVQYRSDLFTNKTIKSLVRGLTNLTKEIIENTDLEISKYSLYSESEYLGIQKLLDNRIHNEPPSLNQVIDDVAKKHPEKIALETMNGELVTYEELSKKSYQIAQLLKMKGIKTGDIVGLGTGRTPNYIIGMLGVMKSNATFLPLDPNYPEQRIRMILEKSKPSLILTESQNEWGDRLHDFPTFNIENLVTELVPPFSEKDHSLEVSNLDSTCYIIFTSGSTGTPNGVEISNRSISTYIDGIIKVYGLESKDRVLQFSPLNFDISIEEIYCCLASGATLILRNDQMIRSPKDFLDKCFEKKISFIDLPTYYWHLLVDYLRNSNGDWPSTINTVIIGGEKPKLDDIIYWNSNKSINARTFNTYGPTEATIVACATTIDRIIETSENFGISIGKPVPGCQAFVLDAALQPVLPGCKGELYLSGTCLAKGYLNDPILTEERFITIKMSKTDEKMTRLYRTGDQVRLGVEGDIIFLDRVDDQVKIMGYRVECQEIENKLRDLDNISDAAVLAIESKNSTQRLKAFVVINRDNRSEATEDEIESEITRALASSLPHYMIPNEIFIIDSIPRTIEFKVDKQKLNSIKKTNNSPIQKARLFQATNYIEDICLQVWLEALGLESIDPDRNFYSMGGNSLKAINLVGALSQKGIAVTILDLFNNPSLNAFCQMIQMRDSYSSEKKITNEQKNILEDFYHSFQQNVQNNKIKRFALSPKSTREWYAYKGISSRQVFNICFALRVENNKINLPIFEKSMNEVIKRHSALRCAFKEDEFGPYMTTKEWQPFKIDLLDFSEIPEKIREEELLTLLTKESQEGMDIENYEVFSFKIIKLNEKESVHFSRFNSMACDGRSISVFTWELWKIYNAFLENKPSPFDNHPISFGEVMNYQNTLSTILDKDFITEKYLRPVFEKSTPLDLPFRNQFHDNIDIKSEYLPFDIGDFHQQLNKIVENHDIGKFSAILAFYAIYLYSITNQSKIVLSTQVLGRTQKIFQNVMGSFANLLFIKIDLCNEDSILNIIENVSQEVARSLMFQDVPLYTLRNIASSEMAIDLSEYAKFRISFHQSNDHFFEDPLSESNNLYRNFAPSKEIILPRGVAGFDVRLIVAENESGISTYFEYKSSNYNLEDIVKFTDGLSAFFNKLVRNLDRSLTEVL